MNSLSEDAKLNVTVSPLCIAYGVAIADYRVLGCSVGLAQCTSTLMAMCVLAAMCSFDFSC